MNHAEIDQLVKDAGFIFIFMKDTSFARVNNKVQFYPNETSEDIEDFMFVVTPEMINADVFVEVDKIATLIERWRRWNESNREITVLGDPTIGK